MAKEQLWAPWRLPYIVNKDDAAPVVEPAAPACFLCRYAAQPERDAQNFVVSRGAWTLTVLNRFPYNNGHLLVAPRAHKADLSDLTNEELLECMQSLQQMTLQMTRLLSAQGFNIGLNLGHVAGAGLPGHLHWHLVPRWNGDTNFMSVLADTDVIPQALGALYELLKSEKAD
jgi:ATP adenylyltransferase